MVLLEMPRRLSLEILEHFALTAHHKATFDKFDCFLYRVRFFGILHEKTIGSLLGFFWVLHPVKD